MSYFCKFLLPKVCVTLMPLTGPLTQQSCCSSSWARDAGQLLLGPWCGKGSCSWQLSLFFQDNFFFLLFPFLMPWFQCSSPALGLFCSHWRPQSRVLSLSPVLLHLRVWRVLSAGFLVASPQHYTRQAAPHAFPHFRIAPRVFRQKRVRLPPERS